MTRVLPALGLTLVLACLPHKALAQINETMGAVTRAAAGELVGAIEADPDFPPRIADPEVELLFTRALPRAAIGATPAQSGEFALLAEVSAEAGRIAKAYILAGSQTGDFAALTPGQRERAGRNFLRFLPEIARLYDFRLKVAARLAEGAALYVAAMPAHAAEDPGIRSGLAAIEAEVRAILVAVLSFVADDNIRDAWRFERMQLLAANAPRFAAFLGIKQSQAIADQALAAAIAEDDPAIGRLLKDFALAILR